MIYSKKPRLCTASSFLRAKLVATSLHERLSAWLLHWPLWVYPTIDWRPSRRRRYEASSTWSVSICPTTEFVPSQAVRSLDSMVFASSIWAATPLKRSLLPRWHLVCAFCSYVPTCWKYLSSRRLPSRAATPSRDLSNFKNSIWVSTVCVEDSPVHSSKVSTVCSRSTWRATISRYSNAACYRDWSDCGLCIWPATKYVTIRYDAMQCNAQYPTSIIAYTLSSRYFLFNHSFPPFFFASLQIDVIEDQSFVALTSLTTLDLSHNGVVAISGQSLSNLDK